MDISIVVTTYNYDCYIEECLNSCIEQDLCNLKYEVIVVDDGSLDDTPRILNQSYPANVKIFRIKNSGIEKASNYGFLKSNGRYIVRVDADDVLLPDFIVSMKEYLIGNHEFIYSNYEVINHNSDLIGKTELPKFDRREIQNRGDFLATGTLVKSEWIKRLNGYQTNKVNSGLENYEFILRLIQLGAKGLHVPRTLFRYRRHGKNISETRKKQIIQNGKDLFIENGLGKFTTNKFHPYGLKI